MHWAPGIPCALCFIGRTAFAKLGHIAPRDRGVASGIQRHCERSEAIHFAAQRKNGLLRRCAPRNDGLKVRHTSPPSSPAKAGDPVFRGASDRTEKPRRTGYPACAEYDSLSFSGRLCLPRQQTSEKGYLLRAVLRAADLLVAFRLRVAAAFFAARDRAAAGRLADALPPRGRPILPPRFEDTLESTSQRAAMRRVPANQVSADANGKYAARRRCAARPGRHRRF